MRLALAPKVAVVEEEDTAVAKEDTVVTEEGKAVAEEDQRVAVASNYRHSTYITISSFAPFLLSKALNSKGRNKF